MVTDEEFIDVFSAKQEGTHGDNTFEDLYDWYETKPSNIELWLHDEQKCYGSIGQPTVQELHPELWEPYGGLGAVAAYSYEESLPRRWERSELMGAWINPDLEKVEHKVHLRLQVRGREVPDKAIVTNANEEEWWYDY